MNIVCVGAGYVGGPSMAVMASRSPQHKVTVFDVSKERIEAWNAPFSMDGKSPLPIFEPGLDDIIKSVRGKNLFFTSDPSVISDADIVFIAVNTPTKLQGLGKGCSTDLACVESCARLIAEHASKERVILVEKSTIPVKCSATLHRTLNGCKKKHVRFEILSNPEFLAEGSAIKDLLNPDRIVIGGENEGAVTTLSSLYENWVSRERIITTRVQSSELGKLVANAFLAQRISSINSICPLCESVGACITEVRDIIGADSRIGASYINPSVAFGGSCFQKDILSLVYLCKSEGLFETAEYWEQVLRINEYSKKRFYEKAVRMCSGTLNKKRIAVLGFAFKKDTGDTRESPAIFICANLLMEGARIQIYDPIVSAEAIYTSIEYFMNVNKIPISELEESGKNATINSLIDYIRGHVVVTSSVLAAVDGASATLVLTEWEEFKEVDYNEVYKKMQKPANILDGKLLLDRKELQQIGFDVFTIGMPGSDRF